MNSLNRVILFGATSAIAEQTARQLVAQGASLYCVGRNRDKLMALIDDLKVRASDHQQIDGDVADLTDSDQHARLIDAGERALGGIDGVLIAHGTLPNQQACQADVTQTRQEIETNALSVISLLTLLANRLEQQQYGVIAVISSVAGDRGRQSNYVYGAAKGMVTLFLQGLRNRLAKSNVDVVTIKPGFVDTPMTAELDKGGPLWAKPEQIAKGIIKAMQKGKGEVYLPWFWWGIMLIIKHIPEAIFKRMSL
ncbi:SDR family oxidoreductase [Chromohalobacter sp. TMW 2.2308]|uniref:SDR family oxidoreductase n=1 Tax=Chromohalobacter TaxID=42054 RepID=UPI00045CFAD1|nr:MULTISPECIES: SDR family oxidoreductase [Chromohalobacter]MCK2042210.1 SDR family oxidoreductase [Chromohalobacter moromii]MCT8514358.1 SDR family oxidoreductase [Chromohalobacter sp. TMW 2.2271]CDQ32816.1 putative oxidoreductase [Virgibacillus halodenitrificans]